MKKDKSTKKALLASILSLGICLAMLAGTTFAWFTDTAGTSVSKIRSGMLDVALEMEDPDGNWVSAEGETLTFTDLDENDLWEPGCTYTLPALKIVNKGSLALKCTLSVTGILGDARLNEAIEWSFTMDDQAFDLAQEIDLAAAEETSALTISGHMKETAGNKYQGLSIDGINITVIAAQDTVEFDSTTDQYDAAAEYPTIVSNTEEFSNALNEAEDGDVVLLSDDMTITSDMRITKDITINGNGNAIEGKPIYVENANVTFENVTLEKPNNNSKNATLVYISGSSENVVFDGCTFSDPQWEAIQITSNDVKNVTITNCTFTAAQADTLGNTGYGSQPGQIIRYIHIEPNPSVKPVMNITITNNTFKNCDKVVSELIGIYYAGEGSQVTVGGNTFEGIDMNADKICVGYPVWITGLMKPNNWTGEITSYTVPAQG